MDAELTAEKELRDGDKKGLRLRSRTTPPATNQFTMSNSLDSGVGSFEEADAGEKSCTSGDELKQSCNEQHDDAPDSFRFIYLGSTLLDKRYTQHMLPWVIAEIRRKNERNLIDLNVEAMTVKAVDCSAASTLFQHKVQTITRCARSVDKKCFAYLTKIPDEVSSCYCYVFEAVETSSVAGFLQSIRDAAKLVTEQTESDVTTNKENLCDEPANTSSNSSPSNPVENAETQAVAFPLWYVGRVVVSHRQAPPTLIDDLVDRFDKRKGMSELEKQLSGQKLEQREGRSNTVSVPVNISVEDHSKEHPALKKVKSFDHEKILSQVNNCEDKVPEDGKHAPLLRVESFGGRPRSASDGDKTKELYSTTGHNSSQNQHHARTHSRNSSFGGVSENRNILFKISIHSIACLSVVSKMLLMERRLREVSFCQQGTKSPEHFGFICHELKTGQYYCYVFKGQSEQLVDDVMQSLRRAFNIAWQAAGPTSVCDMCPLHHLHQLCVQLEGGALSSQYDILQRHRINLTDEEMSQFTEQFKAESPSGMSEEIEVIMAIYRAIYEKRQLQHTHIGQGHQYQKDKVSPNLLQKAKKSLTSSFESFMNKRGRARTVLMEEGSGMEKCESTKPSPGLRRKRSVTLDSAPSHSNPTPPMSPLKELPGKGEDVFTSTPHRKSKQVLPVGTGETSPSYRSPSGSTTTPPNSPTKTPNHHRRLSRHNSYGYRQTIFHSVVTPSKKETISDPELGIPQSASWAEMVGRKKSSQELRALWRKAIMEQILLIRMERENNSLQVNQNVIEANSLKLSYNEVPPCPDAAAATWNKILENGDEPVDMKILIEAVKAGVPKARRGEIWVFLSKQHDLHSPPQEEELWRDKTYQEIKEGSTCHQHSIFIDLGRTFPSHPYFSPQLGHGQLCLFNILKAYSILDEEVGYCQGLSFVAGILLMHMKEEEAYDTLRFIMYALQVRKQYKPDMQDLQTQFYMLSRLLHDYYKPVYEFLLELEITPTLYAAPWFLTLFASHFPVGFVARVMDMMFLQGMDVVFKVILLLLGSCQEEMLSSDGLEGAVEVMKTSLAPFVEQNVEWLVSEVLSLDISKDLESYEVEYCVLKEEDLSVTSFEDIESERVDSLEAELAIKTRQIQNLTEQLSCARNTIHGLESTINTMQINQSELKGIIRSLRAENESLTRNFEKLKNQVLSNGDVVAADESTDTADDKAVTITSALSECSTIKPTSSTEKNASSTEENTDSFEHIGSGNDLTDDEADSDEFTEGKPRTGSGSLPLSDKCEDLVVSR